MKTYVLALLLASAPLVADCFGWEFGGRMGYRWDHLKHTIFEENDPSQPLFRESFQNMSTAQLEGFTKLRLWLFELGVDADYGWTVGGHVRSTLFPLIGTEQIETASFRSCPNGEVWDAFFTGGIRIPFYDCYDRRLHITPLGGYSFHGIREKRRDLRPSSINLGSQSIQGFGISDPTFVSLPKTEQLKRDYKGPFAGASMSILYCRFFTTFGYAYHWIDLEQTTGIDQQFKLFGTTVLVNLGIKVFNSFETHQNRGNRGWISLNYQDPCGWRIGLHGTYFSVSTRKKNSNSTVENIISFASNVIEDTQNEINRAKARWRTFTATIEVAYEF